jgi:hypothetical protein
MPRALHRALRPVQNTQWVTVGHVVAAVAAQAQATDDDFSQIALHCTLCATDFLLIIIGCLCYISSSFFLSVLVFFLSFIFLYYLFRCALL